MQTRFSSPFVQNALPISVMFSMAHAIKMKRLKKIDRLLDSIEAHLDPIDQILREIDGHITRLEERT
jgi:hypothetical protein